MSSPLYASIPSDRGMRDGADQMIAFVRGHIERGDLRPGDRLAPERELVRRVGVSRNGVREGLRSLAAMGVVTTRQGSGTFVTTGPPSLANESLGLLASLHGFTRGGLFEARRVLESSAAALAAERATSEQVATLSDEIVCMYSALGDPDAFLRHDVLFHQAVAAGTNNLALGALIEMVSSLHYEERRAAAERARGRLREAADTHRRIYQAIRLRDSEAARAAMDEHLLLAQERQEPSTTGPWAGELGGLR